MFENGIDKNEQTFYNLICQIEKRRDSPVSSNGVGAPKILNEPQYIYTNPKGFEWAETLT